MVLEVLEAWHESEGLSLRRVCTSIDLSTIGIQNKIKHLVFSYVNVFTIVSCNGSSNDTQVYTILTTRAFPVIWNISKLGEMSCCYCARYIKMTEKSKISFSLCSSSILKW